MATKVILPEMGEGVIEGTISRWLKEEGDRVEQYEPILEIETDKVTTEATAEVAGVLLKKLVNEGDVVPVGTVLAFIGQAGEAVPELEPEAQPEAQLTAVAPPATPPRAKSSNGRQPYAGRISPVVSRIAAEHQVDLSQVTGTGRDGRITKKDILAYVGGMSNEQLAMSNEQLAMSNEQLAMSKPAATAPPVTPSPLPGELMPLTRMRRAIAEHMVRSKQTSPHVTTVFEFDFTAVAAHRAAHKAQFARDGVRLTFTAYLVAAVATALKKHPLVNSSWDENGVRLHRAINIGMAAALDDGLIVPVIKNADSLNLLGLARAVNDLAQRARAKKLQPDEVQGGTFTITNHGVSGSLFANPIINQPHCGILGVGMIEKRVKVIDDAIAIRRMAYVGLTFDHRILDGATADYFMAEIKRIIENWQ